MELALVWYTLLNLVILGLVLIVVRAFRVRAAPDERQDLEENALIAADWELVRREHCLPSGCPRRIGQPPRPRKDVTCEVCAATFLEARLQRLLHQPLAPEPSTPELPLAREALPSRHGAPCARALEAPSGRHPSLSEEPRWRGARRRPLSPAARWALVRFGLGIACVVIGAGIAAFGGLLWLIIPGYIAVLVGLALIASGAASGAI